MKALVCALTISALIIAATVFGATFTDHKLSDFTDEIHSSLPDDLTNRDLIKSATSIEEAYAKIEKYIILLIHDSEAREIEEHISDIKSAAESNEIADVIAAKNRLLLHIDQLRRLSVFSPEAIF